MMKYAFLTLGCKVNQYETQAMEELFKDKGYEEGTMEDCDFFVVNTCTVTKLSDAKSRQMIHRVKRKNPSAIIAVVGCYSQVAPEEIEALDVVDVIIGTKDRTKLVPLCEYAYETGQKVNIVSELTRDKGFEPLEIHDHTNMTRAYLKIQEGCNMFCSYCIIPYARGPIQSRDFDEIVEEAKRLSEKGYQEVILTGIHVASYGKEKRGMKSLIDVIEAVADLPHISRIRLSSIEPRHITRDFLERMKATGKACDHFHLSLQSGSDKILKRMRRKYDTKLYKEKVDLIREVFPNAGLTTDVIVGFPGETEEDFQQTLDFMEEVRFSKVHIFPYSRREGTPAAEMEGQLTNSEKKERVHRLSEPEERHRLEFLDAQIGRTLPVLFEEYTEGDKYIEGYTTNYVRVRIPGEDSLNQIRDVLITRRKGDMLYGTTEGGE